jgi:hypothetical protein
MMMTSGGVAGGALPRMVVLTSTAGANRRVITDGQAVQSGSRGFRSAIVVRILSLVRDSG